MHQVPPPTFRVDGAALRTRRMQLGQSTTELATATGVSDSYIRKLEGGTRCRMRPRHYTALRAALRTTDTDLLTTEDPQERT
ncbi:helix-turn-helix domain-containing protein [Streptomyces sp. H27-D2]|uniref:helix-turn-helix domain-containing protein n=1 Tax=Streptomyces sp. H27-D2 TaxID=3046304 RepID=UPI002DB67F73|nr:helix-turn-helix domain-containing protein [Streptomyces sp. H27-D2]MEC4016006.1 helix-turn-helix domain-containing protein [Streptomyces sp. H27-D2]